MKCLGRDHLELSFIVGPKRTRAPLKWSTHQVHTCYFLTPHWRRCLP